MTDKLLVHYLSQMQGTLFEMSGREGYDSETFIRVFMRSRIAEGLDSDFDFTHWAGKEYIMERMIQESLKGFPDTVLFSTAKLFTGQDIYTVIGISIPVNQVKKSINRRMLILSIQCIMVIIR